MIAREYANLGAREEAIAWLARVQESSPTKAHGGAVWVEYLVGDRDRAREAAERLNEIYSAERWPLSVLSRLDIEAGQADLAVARLESAFPEFAGLDDAELCSRHDVWAVEYAQALKAAGETERARAILEPCLELQFEDYLPRLVYRYRAWVNALLEHREETLELLNWLVHEGHYRVGSFMDFRLEGDEFDFLRDEPEFRDLVQFIEDDLVKQRERIRERERNGELPPAPGVEM